MSKEDILKEEKKADEKLLPKKFRFSNKETEKIKSIIKVLKKYNVKKAGIFGSYARGEQKKNSDVDIIIQAPKDMGIEFVRLNYDLEDALNEKVDLITYNSIHPLIKERILNEEVRIL